MRIKQKKINQRYTIVCSVCSNSYNEKKNHARCPDCNESLDVIYDYKNLAERLNRYDFKNTHEASLKYLDFFPIRNFGKVVSLQEGGTPLYKSETLGKKFGLNRLYVKNEGANPTGVFKDRGTMVEVTKAVELKARAIMVASSGNMAASCAAYAGKAGLPCYVLVPENTPIGKLSQMMSYGAHVIKIRGEYSDCIHLVQKLAPEHNFYLAGDYVFRREGQKSLSYELCEEFDCMAPDVVICPTGAGTHLSGIWKGFVEYKKLGIVKNLPRMIAVQADGAAVLVEAFEKKRTSYKTWKTTKTICSAVAVADPIDGRLVLKAVYDSGGTMLSLSDEEALKAQKLLASKEGIFVEPSSALAIAALPYLIKKKLVKKNETIVCIATGNGLKDPLTPLQNLPRPPILEADHKVVSRYLKSKIVR